MVGDGMSENVRVSYTPEQTTFTQLRDAEVAMGTVHIARLHESRASQGVLEFDDTVPVPDGEAAVTVRSRDVSQARVAAVLPDGRIITYELDTANVAEPVVQTLADVAQPDVLLDRRVATPDQDGYAVARELNSLLFDLVYEQEA
jgi:hypothetical protein